MFPHERLGAALLGAGLALVGALTLGPALFPRPQVPAVTRVALPSVPGASDTEAPVYPTAGSVTPLISGRVNLNTASLEQLEALPKVGPALAQTIVDGRPYHSLADLDRVKGIGEVTLRTLSPLVTW